jgi:hypothetical protein
MYESPDAEEEAKNGVTRATRAPAPQDRANG